MYKKIYTIGSSLRGIEEFLQLLQQHSIENVADVRSFPKSKLLHFCQDELKGSLSAANIEYVHLGKELGVKLAIGTDAHHIDQLCMMKLGVAVARRGWLEPADVLNSYTLAKLREWLKGK